MNNEQMSDAKIEHFLRAPRFAVAGASSDPTKYGHKVLRALANHGKNVVGLHPIVKEVAGIAVYRSLSDVRQPVTSLSIVTPPAVTAQVVADAIEHGVQSIWMQPGAENPEAIAAAQAHGIEVISGGPCLLVSLAK